MPGLIVAGSLTGLLLASLGWALFHPAGPALSTLVGKSAPPMTIAALDGSEARLPSPSGGPMVVNFWASWCVPCRQEAPILNAAAREYSGRIQFVGVDIQDSDAAARAYQAEFQSPYPVGPATAGSYLAWGVRAPPETYFVDRRGVIVARIIGPVDSRRLELYLGQLGPL